MKSFKPKSPVPHVLHELSQKDHRRLVDHCIHLQGISRSKESGTICFDKVVYGAKITKKKQSITFQDTTIPSNEVSLHRMSKKYVLVTAHKSECITVLPQLLTSSLTSNSHKSDIVVLLAYTLNPIHPANKVWIDDDFTRLKKCKPNILQSNSHHESTGYYASFGNKGSFDKSVTSSVGQYTSKKNNKFPKQIIINTEAANYEQCCADELERSVKDISSFLPNTQSILAPVLDTSFHIQTDYKDLNFKETLASNSGCWQSSICVNAQTKKLHTEDDCTYTLISIPNQNRPKESQVRYDFLFNLTGNDSLNIPLKPGVSFMFSGLFLTHRQNKSIEVTAKNDIFFNIASYGNKRLFHHLRKTINER